MQTTEPRPTPFSRTRAGLYGLLTVVLLTALVLLMLAHQALA